ncbi:MAG TPA: sigma-70 family RNA polymerase sigma factor [Novosphingobium sp.]|nr:sigma-70 family RNA polymerase sigma factor [Novosphingobium sp.]
MAEPDSRHTASLADSDAAIRDGAFRQGLTALLPHLRAFARGLCGRPDLADDLVQEAILRAWSARAGFAPGTNLKAWTFTILRNHYLNTLRRLGRHSELDDATADRLLVEPPRQEDGLHLDDLQRALDRLPDERREALLLIGASGFSYEEAARVCGVPVGTMKSRVARGRAQLHTLLDEGGATRPAQPG